MFRHTIMIMNDNTVTGWGYNTSAQLGINNLNNQVSPVVLIPTNVSKVTYGANHSIFIMIDGTVKGCGSNAQGQLGIGGSQYLVPTAYL